MQRKLKQFCLIIMLLPLLLLLGACSSEKKSATTEKQPKEIRIGMIRVPNDKQVAKAEGFFKKHFEDKGIKTKFIFFDSGVAANQAFVSNSIDFAEMGYTNGVVALATEVPVELIWIHEVLGKNEALVARKKAEIKTVSDLKGRKIATPFSSTSHFSLLQALNEAGLSHQEVTLLDMQTSEIVAAWERGDIDAAYTWEPTLSNLKKTGHVLIDSQELAQQGYMTTNIELVHQDFAKKYPELVVEFLVTLNDGVTSYQNDPKKAATSAAKELDLTTEEALGQMEGTTWLSLEQQISADYFGTSAKPGQFNQVFLKTAQFLKEQGSIKKAPTEKEISEFINSSYAEEAMKSRKE